jgi:hypothetical protein
MLTLTTEIFSQVSAEAEQLAAAHWDEVEAALHGAQRYRLDHERYASLERLGMLHISAARGLPEADQGAASATIQRSTGGLRRLYPGGPVHIARKPCWRLWTASILPLGRAAACLPCACCAMLRRPLRRAA